MSTANRALAEIVSVLAFVASILAVALRPQALGDVWTEFGSVKQPVGFAALAARTERGTDMISVIQQPVNLVLWTLLWVVALAALVHLALRWRERFSRPVQVSVSSGLIAAALWPWLPPGWAVLACGLAALAPVLVMAGLVAEDRRRGLGLAAMPMAAVAGWLILGGCSALAVLAHATLGVDPNLALLAALLVATLAIVGAQLLLGERIACALVGIWALIGIAAASFDGSMTIATACVLGIAAMAVAVVRVTT